MAFRLLGALLVGIVLLCAVAPAEAQSQPLVVPLVGLGLLLTGAALTALPWPPSSAR
jgi:hypothetical protein